MNNSTRTYPRTLKDAFKGADYGCAIERPPSRIADRVVTITLWLAAVVVILSICFQGAMK